MVKLDNGWTHPRKGAFKPHSNAFKKGAPDKGFYHLLSRRKYFVQRPFMKVKPIICAVLKKMQQMKLGLKLSPIIERDYRLQDPLRQLCYKKV